MNHPSSTKQQLCQRYSTGDRTFTAIDLYQEDLAEVELVGADLSKANLCGANLTRADLRDVDFRDANLSQANLQFANLSNANLTGANLRRADLTGAKLDGAILDRASLTGTLLPNGTLFAPKLTADDRQDLTPLTQAEIHRDLQTVAKPQPQIKPKVIEPISRSRKQFIRDLPKIPLCCLAGGLFLFGFQGGVLNVNLIGYLLILAGVWGCGQRPEFGWFLPAIGGMVIFSSGGNSLVVICCVVMFIISTFATHVGGQSLENSSKGSLWLSAIGTVVAMILSMTFSAPPGYYAGIILIALLLSGFGSVSADDLRIRRYSRSQITQITLIIGSVAMAIGVAIGWIMRLAMSSSPAFGS